MLRYERKYLVPYSRLDELRACFSPFVRCDEYASRDGKEISQYTVRSIYFDTLNLECHQEKMEGVELRKKFRIRSYNQYDPKADAVFEIKRKIENRIKKHRAFTIYEKVAPLMQTGDVDRYINQDSRSIEDARRFFFHIKKRNMRPTVLVVYEREAYHGKFDDGVRVTFDKNIRSSIYPQLSDLFNNHDLKHLFPRHFILEIKYFTQQMPTWAKSIVQKFRLRNDALSKYAIGYDIHTKYNIFSY